MVKCFYTRLVTVVDAPSRYGLLFSGLLYQFVGALLLWTSLVLIASQIKIASIMVVGSGS